MMAANALSAADAAAVLSLTSELWLAGSEFQARLAHAVRTMTGADLVTVDGFDAGTGERTLLVDPPAWEARVRRYRPNLYRNLAQHPVAQTMLAEGSPDVRRVSDVTALADWRRTQLYQSYYEPLGLTWEMIMPVPVSDGRIIIITINSTRDFATNTANFTERDVAVCQALVPAAVLGFGGLPEGSTVAWSGIAYGWYLVVHDINRVVSLVVPPDPDDVLVPGLVLPPLTADRREGDEDPTGTLTLADGDWRVHPYISSPKEQLVAMQRVREIPPDLSHLTGRQRDVLALISRGFTNGQIATELGIAEGTVRKHVQSILSTLSAGNRAAAAAMWYAHTAAIPLRDER